MATTDVKLVRCYANANGAVAYQATDGDAWWLADLDGERISPFCANRAQVSMEAWRRFGRLMLLAGDVYGGQHAYPWDNPLPLSAR